MQTLASGLFRLWLIGSTIWIVLAAWTKSSVPYVTYGDVLYPPIGLAFLIGLVLFAGFGFRKR